MRFAGFEIYDSEVFGTREQWEEHVKATCNPTIAERTLLAAPYLEFWQMHEAAGFIASDALRASFHELAADRDSEFSTHLDAASSVLIQEVTDFLSRTQGSAQIPRTIPARRVLDYVNAVNPFFQRWLAFQSERPRLSPSEWEEYAAAGLNGDDIRYSQAMRELGQTLQELSRERARLSEFIAFGLMHSHTLVGEDRYSNTMAWLHMAQKDSAR